MPLPPSKQMEELSLAYVWTIASSNGYACERKVIDYEGYDLSISTAGNIIKNPKFGCPEVKIQLKSTREDELISDEGCIYYDLDVKNYKWLIDTTNVIPKILVLLVLPDNNTEWIAHSVEMLTSRKCAYWVSLRGLNPTENIRTKRISIPKCNYLSPSNLTDIMMKISKGESLC